MSVDTPELRGDEGICLPRSWVKEESELVVRRKKGRPDELEKTPLRIAIETFYKKYSNEFASIQFPLEQLPFEIVHRFFLLDQARFLEETFETIKNIRKFIEYNNRHTPEDQERFTDNQERAAILATLLSDIGKTGPDQIGFVERGMYSAFYSIHGISDTNITVVDFLEQNKMKFNIFLASLPKRKIDETKQLDKTYELIEQTFEKNFDKLTMKGFYGAHVLNSLMIASRLRDWLESTAQSIGKKSERTAHLDKKVTVRATKSSGRPITLKVQASIAAHHYFSGVRDGTIGDHHANNIFDGLNGYFNNINANRGNTTRHNLVYGNEMALVFLFDVYMAQVKRGNIVHTKAIGNLRRMADKVTIERHRNMFNKLLKNLDDCFRENEVH